MNNIWCEDIVYNIMINLDLPTLHVLQLVAKLSNNVCNNNNFWKYMLKKDYENFVPLSNKLKHEYEKIYLSHKSASNILNLHKDSDILVTNCFNIDTIHMYWLPIQFQFIIYKRVWTCIHNNLIWFTVALNYPNKHVIYLCYDLTTVMLPMYMNDRMLLEFLAHIPYNGSI